MENIGNIIQTLETAAEVLLASPNLVTSEQRHQAENVFLEFRSTKNPYQLCREILEKSNSSYVLFEAAGLIKNALIREWNLLSESDISSLREYLVNYLLIKETQPFLREKILQTVAIIIKRGSIDDGGRERKVLLGELEQIILNSPIHKQKLALSLILAIMQEYAVTVKSADVGLVWEVHFNLKKSFETIDMKRIFRFTVGVLEQIVASGIQLVGDQALLTKQLLTIVETILCWGQVSPLLPKRLIGAFESIFETDTSPALRLGSHWADTILQPKLIALFFEIHMYVRFVPDLVGHTIICLTQLASLSGVVVSDSEIKKQYLKNYVNNLLSMLANIQPIDKEFLGVADIYRKLIQFYTPSMITSLPSTFLQNLTKLTCHCIRASIIEEGAQDDTIWKEALTKFFHTWSTIVHEPEDYSNEMLTDHCTAIFNTYLQCRLAPPDGTRGTESKDGCSDDIKDDIEEDERKMHSNILLTVGAVARKIPAHCFHILFTLLQDRNRRLQSHLQLMHMGKLPLSCGEQMISLFEDLHWILMITGHFIAIDCTEGEMVLIPREIIQHSKSENADIDASVKFLVGETTDINNVDSIFKIMGEIMRISACECAALEAGLGEAFSPELSATISWLLKIWANSYLISQMSPVSPVLESALCSNGSGGAAWVISRLAGRAAACLRRAASQPTIAHHAIDLLATLASLKHKDNPLATCEEFLSLVAWEAAGSNLSGELRRKLHRTFAIAASYAEGEVRNRLLSSTVALQEKLLNLLNMESDTEPVRNALADTIDCYIGITEGVYEIGETDQQFIMLNTALDKIPTILYRYHNYPSVVLPALNFLAKSAKWMFHSIDTENATKFMQVCNTTFDVYARWNSGKISNIPDDIDEEAYEDVCALMEVLSSVSQWSGGRGADDARAVCERGLRVLLPLVTPRLLAMPTLSRRLYRMLRDLDATEQISNLPIEDFNMVVSALRVGLTSVSCDVTTLCCETIAGLSHKARLLEDDNPYAVSLLSLAELLLMLIIKMEIPTDTIPSAGAAIYALTCIKPALLEGLARQIIVVLANNDPDNVPRLEEAFSLLTSEVLFDGMRPHKVRFQDNFEKFLANIQGFLLIK